MKKDNINILFIGRFFPNRILSTIIKDTAGLVEFSNHNFEMSILDGLTKQEDINLKIFSVPGTYPYPTHNKKLYQRSEHYKMNGAQVCSLAMFNLIGINRFVTVCNAFFKLLRILKSFDGDAVYLIVNIPTFETLYPIELAQKITEKTIKKVLVVPDVPTIMDVMGYKKSIVARLRHMLSVETMQMAQRYDRYVFLTDAMKEFFDKCSNPKHYIVAEGLIDKDVIMPIKNTESNAQKKEVILYAGSLKRVFGIENLVEAFQMIKNDDIELWICGSGDFQDTIKEMSQKDKRIRFLGLVSSERAKELQSKATILVNPRTSKGAYTKYSFPSKTIEYLLSGKSVIMNYLSGVPDEYYQYVYVPKDETVEALAEKIKDVIADDHIARNEKRCAGREFIITKKNSVYQTKRIIDMIREC